MISDWCPRAAPRPQWFLPLSQQRGERRLRSSEESPDGDLVSPSRGDGEAGPSAVGARPRTPSTSRGPAIAGALPQAHDRRRRCGLREDDAARDVGFAGAVCVVQHHPGGSCAADPGPRDRRRVAPPRPLAALRPRRDLGRIAGIRRQRRHRWSQGCGRDSGRSAHRVAHARSPPRARRCPRAHGCTRPHRFPRVAVAPGAAAAPPGSRVAGGAAVENRAATRPGARPRRRRR